MTKTIMAGAVLALGMFSGTAFSAGLPSGTICLGSSSCGTNIDSIGFQVSLVGGQYVAMVATLQGGNTTTVQLSLSQLISLVTAKLGSAGTPLVQELQPLEASNNSRDRAS